MAFATIRIRNSRTHELRLFYSYLHSKSFPEKRELIFSAHPELTRFITKTGTETGGLKQYLDALYRTDGGKIDNLIKTDRNILRRSGHRALQALAKSMDYAWKKKITYTALPTLLPFSPYGTRIFYYSILGRMRGRQGKSVLYIAIHEISHFLFFDIVRDIESRTHLHLSNDAMHYVKEALTTALLNTQPLKRILHAKNDVGNPELHSLFVRDGRRAAEPIAKWIQRQLQSTKRRHIPFELLCEQLLRTFVGQQKALQGKRMLWGRYGMTLVPLFLRMVHHGYRRACWMTFGGLRERADRPLF